MTGCRKLFYIHINRNKFDSHPCRYLSNVKSPGNCKSLCEWGQQRLSWDFSKTNLENYLNAPFLAHGFPAYTQVLCTDTNLLINYLHRKKIIKWLYKMWLLGLFEHLKSVELSEQQHYLEFSLEFHWKTPKRYLLIKVSYRAFWNFFRISVNMIKPPKMSYSMENTAKQTKTYQPTKQTKKIQKRIFRIYWANYLTQLMDEKKHFCLEFGDFCLDRKYDETIFEISDLLDFS